MKALGSVVARFCGVAGCPIASLQVSENVGTEVK